MKKQLIIYLTILTFILQAAFLPADDNPAKQVSKKAVKLMKKADKAVSEQKVEKAIEYYQKVIAIEPEYAPPYYGLAQIQHQQKQFDQAVENLQKAIQYDPVHSKAISLLANTLFFQAKQKMAQKQTKEAMDFLSKITNIKNLAQYETKILINAYYFLGAYNFSSKDYENANAYLIKILETPNAETEDLKAYLAALYIVGLNFTQLNQPEKGNEYLLKYIEMNAENPTDRFLPIAHFLLASNKMNKLTNEVEKIKKDKNKDKKGRIQKLAETNIDIEKHLKIALELKNDMEQAYVNLGNFYYYLNEIKKAIQIYQQLLEKFPDSQDAQTYKKFITDLEKSKNKKKKQK